METLASSAIGYLLEQFSASISKLAEIAVKHRDAINFNVEAINSNVDAINELEERADYASANINKHASEIFTLESRVRDLEAYIAELGLKFKFEQEASTKTKISFPKFEPQSRYSSDDSDDSEDSDTSEFDGDGVDEYFCMCDECVAERSKQKAADERSTMADGRLTGSPELLDAIRKMMANAPKDLDLGTLRASFGDTSFVIDGCDCAFCKAARAAGR